MMVFSGFVRVFCLLIMLAMSFSSWAQTAYLMPPTVFEGDITELIIEHQSKVPSLYALDTSSLERDFEVLKRTSKLYRQAESDEVVNRMRWTVMISPRRSGKLEIPSLSLGGSPTPSLVLDVIKQTPEVAARQKVIVEMAALPENPYVGQQTVIKLRLLHNTPLISGILSEPVSEQVDLFRSGEESHYSQLDGGERFDVIERDIALFTSSPGELTLAPANFRGQIPASQSPSRRINRNSDSLHLQVRDIPTGFSGKIWLPASDLLISESWSQPAENLKVGDSINRSLKIVARGLPAGVLPEDILTSNTEQVKVYPDQAGRENRFDGPDLIGSLSQSFVVVIAETGEIALPAVRLRWWDVDEDVEKVTVIPERRISVVDANTIAVATELEQLSTWNIKVWLVFGLLLSVIIALIFWLKEPQSIMNKFINNTKNRSLLKKACLAHQPLAARQALLNWAASRWPDENMIGLFQIRIKISSSDLNNQIRQLDEVLFSPHRKPWNGERLYRLLRIEQRRLVKKVSRDQSGLPRLYPDVPANQ